MEKEKRKTTRQRKIVLGTIIVAAVASLAAIERLWNKSRELEIMNFRLEGENRNLKTMNKGQQKQLSNINYQLGKLAEKFENKKN